MTMKPRVEWQEGLVVGPVHLQLLEDFHEELVSRRRDALVIGQVRSSPHPPPFGSGLAGRLIKRLLHLHQLEALEVTGL